MTDRIRVAVLGSTGSIGRQTLQVAADHPDRIEIVALAAYSNAELLAEQAQSVRRDAGRACRAGGRRSGP